MLSSVPIGGGTVVLPALESVGACRKYVFRLLVRVIIPSPNFCATKLFALLTAQIVPNWMINRTYFLVDRRACQSVWSLTESLSNKYLLLSKIVALRNQTFTTPSGHSSEVILSVD